MSRLPGKQRLRERIVRSLRRQGFSVRAGSVAPPSDLTKDQIRQLHETAVRHRRAVARITHAKFEEHLLSHMASGSDIDVGKIKPRLVQVGDSDSEEARLFRYSGLHWSIPLSSGYGRRLRFLVEDEQNDKLIGLIGLADPVFSLGVRDSWIGWDEVGRKARLQNVMDAFVLGAVPPYASLLCGKLVAMLVASREVRDAFRRKYKGRKTRIRRRTLDGRLALITTTSALGRSSIYNRIKIAGRRLYESLGLTRGAGEFHFANGTYDVLKAYATRHCEASSKKARWGTGFRNRREVIKKCLPALGISSEWIYHGIGREAYAVHIAENAREFLRGECKHLRMYDDSVASIFEEFRQRWLVPRASRETGFRSWTPDDWRLWTRRSNNGGNGHVL